MSVNSSPDAIASTIIELRKYFGETQQDLANAINCNQNNISKIENGGSLTIGNLIDIANHYNVSLDYLCTGKEGKDLLDTLCKYVQYDIRTTSGIDETTHLIPHIEIENNLYKCLRQIALAKSNKEMPPNIKEAWIKDAINHFTQNTISTDKASYISFIPLKNDALSNKEITKAVEEHFIE